MYTTIARCTYGLITCAAALFVSSGPAQADPTPTLAPTPPPDQVCVSEYNPFTDTFDWTCGLGE